MRQLIIYLLGSPIKYSLILNGNIGFDGLDNVIKMMRETKKLIILKGPLGEYSYQEPDGLETYVLNNYTQTGKIEHLRIFENK